MKHVGFYQVQCVTRWSSFFFLCCNYVDQNCKKKENNTISKIKRENNFCNYFSNFLFFEILNFWWKFKTPLKMIFFFLQRKKNRKDLFSCGISHIYRINWIMISWNELNSNSQIFFVLFIFIAISKFYFAENIEVRTSCKKKKPLSILSQTFHYGNILSCFPLL